MEATLSPKIKQTVNATISMYFSLDEEKLNTMVAKIIDQIKTFMKQQQSNMSKDIAKKTKQLFILSSDNQSLKQKIEQLQQKIKRLNQKVAQKQKAFIKLMNDKQRQRRQIQQVHNQKVQTLKKQINNLQYKLQQTQIKFKGQIFDIRRIHKQQISKAILHQQQVAEQNIQQLKRDYAEQKRNLIATQNKQRSQLIKKYQNKLQDLRDKNQEETHKLTLHHNQIHQKDRKIKADLQNQVVTNQNNIKRLQGQLNRQSLGHKKFKSQTENLNSQLAQIVQNHNKKTESLQSQIRKIEQEHSKSQRKLRQQLHALRELLNNTIKEKDFLFEQTVNTMKNQHHVECQTIKNNLMQQKQIALNDTQTKHYEEVTKLQDQQYRLQKQHNQLHQKYKVIKDQYQQKIATIIRQYQETISGIQSRNEYQLSIEGQSSKKNTQIMQRKYKLQIKALSKQYQEMKQDLTKKINQERISTTNKLTTHFQAMINDIKVNNDVSMKQKLIQFDRKSKGYEKKLQQAEKRRTQLKIQMDRQKLDSQMKIDGLTDVNQKLQLEIQELHDHMMKIQKQKTKIINQYEFKLLLKNNQLRQAKDDYQIKQQQLRNILNQNIRIKNSQIQKFSQKVTAQVEDMIIKHNQRIFLLEKQYHQLKKVMNQRTSLPQDVQALKIFHKSYVRLQQQLQKQRKMKINVQRQLQSKCQIQKVFVGKTAFVPKVTQKIPINVVTMRQFYSVKQKQKQQKQKVKQLQNQKDKNKSQEKKKQKQKILTRQNSFRLMKYKSQHL